MVEYEDAAAAAILSLISREYGLEKAVDATDDRVLRRILKDIARIIRSRIPASKPTGREWRPMRTAPKDGTVVEVLHGRASALAAFDVDFWKEYDGAVDVWTISNPSAWRPAHPEWNEDPDES